MRKVFCFAGVVWLAINLLTLTAYPAVWVDEILFSDVGAHLAQGRGFVSAAWFNQPSWGFWAGYTPLYSFLLAGWLKVFGVSALAVRSFSLVLVTVSLILICLVLTRLDKALKPAAIILALAVCEPVAFLERAGRPDSASLLLLAATAFVLVEKTGRWRGLLICLLGALAIPAALQYAAYVVVLAVLLHIWFKPFARRDLALWGTGVASGAAVLAMIYAAHGVLKLFLEVTVASKHSSAGRLLQSIFLGHGERPFVLADIATASLRDYATPVLVVTGVVTWIAARRQERRLACRLSSFGVACAVLIPLSLQLLGKYPLYYCYMGAVPATIAILAACAQFDGKGRFAQVAICTLLLIGGAGRLWWQAWRQGTQTFVDNAGILSNQDTVVADYAAYYQVIGKMKEVFVIDYAGGKLLPRFPERQAATVIKLVVRDSRFAEVANKVGGEWVRVGDATVMRHGALTKFVIIDDDTRHPSTEKIGIYVRARVN